MRGSAIVSSGYSMIKLLIRKGTDIEQKVNNLTAFAFAFVEITKTMPVSVEHMEILKCLLRSGANPNVMAQQRSSTTSPKDALAMASTRNIVTPLQLVVRKANRDLTRLLLSHGADITMLEQSDWDYMRDHDKPMLRLVEQFRKDATIINAPI